MLLLYRKQMNSSLSPLTRGKSNGEWAPWASFKLFKGRKCLSLMFRGEKNTHTHKLYGAEFSATLSNLAKEATLLYSFKSTLDRVLAIIP